jgi:cytoskeletal protein CcmA (bactofilin family)
MQNLKGIIMLKNFMRSTSRNANEETSNLVMEAAKAQVEIKPEKQVLPTKPAPREEGNKLIVGPNIKLKGTEITDCQILEVEGRVEASMNSRDIRIAEGGVFSGKAEIDVAEIRGLFEGELTARKQLVIYASGKVTGKIRYGALTIEEGGAISGDVAAIIKDAQNTNMVAIADPVKAEPSLAEMPKVERLYAPSVLGRTPLGGRRN